MLLAIKEVIKNLLTLGITNFLQNDLLGRLRANPPKIDRLKRLLKEVADFNFGILLLCFGQRDMLSLMDEIFIRYDFPTTESFKVASFAINHHAHVGIIVDTLFGCRRQRHLKCTKDDILGHILFARQHINQQQNFAAHIITTP